MSQEMENYLNHKRKECKKVEEVMELIATSFEGIEPYVSKGSHVPYVLDTLSYIGYCVSLNELTYFFGPFFSLQTVKNRCSQRAKGGDFKLLRMPHTDMGAYKAFRLTPDSYSYLACCLPDNIKPLRGTFKIRRSGDTVPEHDYGVGISLLSLMLLEQPFYFEKEETHSVTGALKRRGSVCIDACVYLKGERPYRLYLEQDMGTENTATLVGKIATYKYMGLTNSDSCIIISSHQCLSGTDCPSFSIPSLEGILLKLKQVECQSLYEYYGSSAMLLSDKETLTMKALFVRIGICDAYADASAVEKGATLKPEAVTKECVLVRRRYIDTYFRMEIAQSAHYKDITVQELEEYVQGLKQGVNPYRMSAYGKIQSHVAKQKFKNMCLFLADMLHRGQLSDEVLCLLMGYPCFVLPSCLLSEHSDIFYPDDGAFLSRIKKCLTSYYPGLYQTDYKEIGGMIAPEGFQSFRLRNEFCFPNGQRLYIEHIGKDVGAFLRVMYFTSLMDELREIPLHVVCVCDNEEDMYLIHRLTGFSVKYARFPSAFTGCFLSFLMETDLGRADCCLMNISQTTGKATSLLTEEQKKLFNEFIHNGHKPTRINYMDMLNS